MSEYCTCATSFDGSCEIHDQITALKAQLAEITEQRDIAEANLARLQDRWDARPATGELEARLAEAERLLREAQPSAVYALEFVSLRSKLAEAEQMRAHELAYVSEACTAAALARGTHESRDALLDLRAWATSRAAVKVTPSQPSPATDPERVEIARCPSCGGLPRPTLMGRAICDRCGGLDVPQPPSSTVLRQIEELARERAADNSSVSAAAPPPRST